MNPTAMLSSLYLNSVIFWEKPRGTNTGHMIATVMLYAATKSSSHSKVLKSERFLEEIFEDL